MARNRHHFAHREDAQQEFNEEQDRANRNAALSSTRGQDQWAMNQMAGMLQSYGRNPNDYNYSPDKYHSDPIRPTAFAISKDHSEKCEFYHANKCGGQGSSYGGGFDGHVDCGQSQGHISCYSHGQLTLGEGRSMQTQYEGITSAPAGSKIY